jgi:sterol desaturase/sphingolipid hydroxylase (fatty acid hydroxylase superfamily)
MMYFEKIRPLRTSTLKRSYRWSSHLGLVLADTVLLRLLLPSSIVAFALELEHSRHGLFNLPITTSVPGNLKILLGIVLMDLLVYCQHWLFHKVPLLWRVHRVHHADIDFDVTTALRFHPIEILISALIKLAAVAIFGISATSVLVFEIILNGTAMFNHSNIRINRRIDQLCRVFVVTPDMHRIHHSVIQTETDSNFGFNLTWWDRLFGTYLEHSSRPQTEMLIGLSGFQTPETASLFWILLSPFRR